MRIPFRSIATLLMAVGVATCSDAPSSLVGTHPVPRRAIGRLGFEPQFSRSAQAVYEQRNDFNLHFDSVHVVIRGYPDTTVIVKDTTVFFADTSSALTLDLDVPVQTDGQRFNAALAYEDGHTVIFSGSGIVQSHAPDKPAPSGEQTITIDYKGPGNDATRIVISPKTASIRADAAVDFTLSAFDASNKPTTPPPTNWSVSNAALADVANASSGGASVVGRGLSGQVTVIATSVSTLSDQATITLTSPPSAIVLVSGSGQSGKVGSTLPQPAVVRVVAADNSGVPGVTVIFSAPAGGGVGSPSVVTDGSGAASTTLKLGTATGTQGFAATALGFSVGISETATSANPASIAVVSGDAQTDTVGHTLKEPFVVKVTDAFGNPVSGVTVSWSRTGNGTLAAETSTTGKDGTSSVGYTLGKSTGADEISASVNGLTSPAKFTATAVAGGAAAIEVVSGGDQSGTVGRQLAAPFVVKVSDALGNPASGATVTWATGSGTLAASTTTDSKGVSENTLTFGQLAGDLTVTASISSSKVVTFKATSLAGPATTIAFSAQPTSVTAGSTMPAVSVKLTDSFGNLTSLSGSVTLALGNNPGHATLSGTLQRNVVNGVATFDDLKLDKPGTGYTLVATSGGLSATSNAFKVTVGTPTQLQLVGSSSVRVTAGAATGLPKILVTDAVGNGVANVPVRVVKNGQSPARTVGDTIVTTATDGTFDFNQFDSQINKSGVFTVTSSVTGLQGSPATFTLNVSPAAASKVVFLTSPGASNAGSPLAPQPQVTVVDAFGNTVTSATNAITLAIQPGTGTAGAVLSGTTTVSAVNGIASFTGLSIDKAGAGYCLQATAAGLTSSCSPPFPVNAGAASKLVILQQPSSATAGTNIGAINVAVVDANGNIITSATNAITLALTTNPGSGTLAGTLTQSAVNGVATFGGLSIDKAAIGYEITASAGGLASVSTNAFNVSAAVAAKLAFTTPPSNAQAGVAMSPAVVVQIQDAFGNPVPATNSVTIGIQSGPAGAQISGNGPTAAQNGNATFSNLQLNTVGSYTLIASSGTMTGATGSLDVSAGAPSALQSSASQFTIPAGSTIGSGTVSLTDGSHNPIVGAQITFTMKQGLNEVSGLTPRVLTTDATGTVSLADLTVADLGTKAGVFNLEASSARVSPVQLTLTINPATASKLIITQQPSSSVASGGTLATQPVLQIQDQYGNATTIATPVTASVSSGTLGGTKSITPSAGGVVAFTDLSITATAGNVTFAFAGSGLATATSNSIAVGVGAASQLVLSPASPSVFTVTAGSNPVGAPVIKSLDAGGNPVGHIPVHFVVDTGSSHTTVSFVDTATDASGVLAFVGSMPTTAGAFHITATSTSVAGATVTATVGITPAAPAKIAFVVPPGTSNYSGQAGTSITIPTVAVAVEDQFGNVTTESGTSISIALGNNPVNGTLTGNLSQNTSSGISAFPDLKINKAAIGYTLTATSGSWTATSLPINISAGAASQLAFTVQPSNATSNTAIAPPISVQVQDQFGNVVGGAANQVTLAIANVTTGASLTGNIETADNGNATFSSAKIDLAGTYTLTASATLSGQSVTSPASNSFTVSPASAATIALAAGSPSTASIIAGGTIASPPSVVVKDGSGNAVPGASVTLSVKQGSTVLHTHAATTDGTGTVSFNVLTTSDLPTATGAYTIEATSGSIGPVIVGLSVAAAAPSTLDIGAVPGTIGTNASLGSVSVTLKDTFGNVATNATGLLTMSLSGGATLNGTTSVAPSSGVATFTDLSVPAAGTYTLTATYGSVTATSSSFSVTGGVATHLAFVQQPTAVTSLAAMSPAVTVEVLDVNGARVTSSNVPIMVSLHTPAGATLRGTLTENAVNGLATFSDLNVDLAGTYTLDASSSPLTGTTNNTPFTVAAGAAAALSLSHGGGMDAPGSIPVDSSFTNNGASGPKVQVVDAAGNPVSIANITVNADVESDVIATSAPGPSDVGAMFFTDSLTIKSALTDTAGVADFSGAKLRGAVGGKKIHFTATYNGRTLTEVRSSHLILTHGRGRSMSHEVALPAHVTPGHTLVAQPRVRLVDVDGNPVSGEQLDILFDPHVPGDLVGGAATATLTTDNNGEATIPSWTVGNVGAHAIWVDLHADHNIRADATVYAAPPDHIAVTGVPSQADNGAQLSTIEATVVDSAGEALEDTAFTISASAHSNDGKNVGVTGTLTASTNNNGKSSFSNLNLDADADPDAALDFSIVYNDHAIHGSSSIKVNAGNPQNADVDAGSSSTISVSSTVSIVPSPTIVVKDHNRHNAAQAATVTWELNASCPASLSFSNSGQLLISSAMNPDPSGKVTAPTMYVGNHIGTSNACTLTAHVTNVPDIVFGINLLLPSEN